MPVTPKSEWGFKITLESIQFLTRITPGVFINSAYADCEPDGDSGLKYRITEINIYADSIFDSSIPDGESLESLFNISLNYNYFPLKELNGYNDKICHFQTLS